MEVEGNSNCGTSVAFLEQLRGRHSGRLNVIWDNAPALGGEALREYLRTPEMDLQLVNLPGYSPDFNADEAIWGWAREEATGNLCLGTREAVQERVGNFLAGLAHRQDEVRQRCRTVLQSKAEALPRYPRPDPKHTRNAHPTLALQPVSKVAVYTMGRRCERSREGAASRHAPGASLGVARCLLMSCCRWIIPPASWPSSSTPWTARTGGNSAWRWRATHLERRPIIPRHC